MHLLTSNFFSTTSLPNFWLINLTIVLDLPNWWQSFSISDLEILIFNCEKISITFFSSWSSFFSAGMPWISRLFLLVYWSCLFEAFYNSNNLASRFSHFIWSLIFSSLSASIIESQPSHVVTITTHNSNQEIMIS